MTAPIDFTAERIKREAPDANCVTKDSYGRPLYRYLVDYQRGGNIYCFSIWAYSQEDAEDHIISLKYSAEYQGQVYVWNADD